MILQQNVGVSPRIRTLKFGVLCVLLLPALKQLTKEDFWALECLRNLSFHWACVNWKLENSFNKLFRCPLMFNFKNPWDLKIFPEKPWDFGNIKKNEETTRLSRHECFSSSSWDWHELLDLHQFQSSNSISSFSGSLIRSAILRATHEEYFTEHQNYSSQARIRLSARST